MVYCGASEHEREESQMAEDQPGPPGGREDRPGEHPTEPLGGQPSPSPAQPAPSPPPSGQPGYRPPDQSQGYGQPEGYGQAQGYGYGYGYGYQAPPPADSSAIAALVIAIAGFFICPPVGAVVALVLANSAEKRIEASGGRLSGLDQARAARIIAIVELILSAVVILLGVLLVAASLGPRF
jgi:hypothetical protein